LPPNADYCTLVDFFLAHSTTEFFYFRSENGKLKNAISDIKINLQKLFDRGEVSSKDNTAKVTLYSENNDAAFENISKILQICLKRQWNIRNSENRVEFKEIEGLRRILLEKENEVTRLSIFTR
jgi:hypothetical protein